MNSAPLSSVCECARGSSSSTRLLRSALPRRHTVDSASTHERGDTRLGDPY